MDALNRWFLEASESPIGSVLLFILVFLARITIDETLRRRESKHKHKQHKRVVHDG